MSQTKTILSYIHQNFEVHSRQGERVPPEKSGSNSHLFYQSFQKQLSPPHKPRRPLAHSFPFTECTDVSLKQSRESIVQGIRLSNKQYRQGMGQGMLWSLIRESYSIEDNNELDQDPEVSEQVLKGLRQQLQLPSILLKYHEPHRDVAMEKFHKVLLACLQKKLGFHGDLSHDIEVREALNYASNLFLQDLKSSAKTCLSESLHGSPSKLAEDLSSLAYDFVDKYEEISLDTFEDIVFDGTTSVLLQEPGASLEQPVYYKFFEEIWKLDPPNLLEFRVDVFIDEYQGMLNHKYTTPETSEICTNGYGETGLKMNILRFYWVYREMLHGRNIRKSTLDFDDMDKVDQFDVLRDTVDQLTIGDQERQATRSKAKSLRFAEPPMVESA